MKKLDKLKLHNLVAEGLSDKEMNIIRGGKSCTCSCAGPSGAYDNSCANYGIGSGGHSTSGSNGYTCGD
ncbi:TIGR04149 family rSAM-modified RiPP [Dysgonomonas sp. ZJ709]|uniref:TIGR04149 family rSAM-modified RiPP n=1 Tax=Dysgonomonas sp. ZJ709 TaxID=2709797 RepID=UPI0013ED2A48|nr:TIGR04149 family rSAM-modified RiPP [Dysgonomonas sp. ZJ709]